MKPSLSAKLESQKNLHAHMINKTALDGPGSRRSS